MTKNSKISLLIICVVAFAVAAYFFRRSHQQGNISSNGEGHSHFKVETFKEETGWAYRIYQDTTKVIEQRYIPGIPGTKGFQTEKQALTTGQFAKDKLDSGIFPPTITTSELDSLGIVY